MKSETVPFLIIHGNWKLNCSYNKEIWFLIASTRNMEHLKERTSRFLIFIFIPVRYAHKATLTATISDIVLPHLISNSSSFVH
jgi:hypothetical protein